jgi:hypothetical protein
MLTKEDVVVLMKLRLVSLENSLASTLSQSQRRQIKTETAAIRTALGIDEKRELPSSEC